MKKNKNGVAAIGLVILIFLVGIGLLVFMVISKSTSNKKKDDFKSPDTSGTQAQGFIWRQTAAGWEAQEKAPDCPAQPILKAPADLSKVTSVLYPGQKRGPISYKPHGGLRFDSSSDNNITVTAPMDGYIISGTRFIADGGTEIQYSFSIMNNCGITNLIGHLRELPANLQKIVETFPEATKSSASQNVNPPVYVKQGDVLATKVGIIGDRNTFFDWGYLIIANRMKQVGHRRTGPPMVKVTARTLLGMQYVGCKTIGFQSMTKRYSVRSHRATRRVTTVSRVA